MALYCNKASLMDRKGMAMAESDVVLALILVFESLVLVTVLVNPVLVNIIGDLQIFDLTKTFNRVTMLPLLG